MAGLRVAEINPLKQGLKPAVMAQSFVDTIVAEINPLKQGLKQDHRRSEI